MEKCNLIIFGLLKPITRIEFTVTGGSSVSPLQVLSRFDILSRLRDN